MWSKETVQKAMDEVLPTLKDEMISFSDYISNHPECSGEEVGTAQYYKEVLSRHGLDVELPFIGKNTAFRCRINAGKSKKFALLCEYDALPEVGHACGHSVSGAISLWAFLVLAKLAGEMDAQVDLIGTPDEEANGAKCIMADQDVFSGYDFAAMCHMGPVNTLDVDFIALQGLTLEFKGKAAHAAQAPELGINALNGARLFFDGVDMMRQHVSNDIKLHGYISNGGVAANIVPDFVQVQYMVRAPKVPEMLDVSEWVKDCARGAALATRCEVDIKKCGETYYDLQVPPVRKELMRDVFDQLGMELVDDPKGFVGSSDIGNVDYCCPTFHPIIGVGDKDLVLHSAEFAQAMTNQKSHLALENGVKVLLRLVERIYQGDHLDQLTGEFKKVRQIT